MRRGGGAPSFCWQCQKQLQRAPGKGRALFYYHVVKDADGKEHRVHGDCLEPCIADGNAWLKP